MQYCTFLLTINWRDTTHFDYEQDYRTCPLHSHERSYPTSHLKRNRPIFRRYAVRGTKHARAPYRLTIRFYPGSAPWACNSLRYEGSKVATKNIDLVVLKQYLWKIKKRRLKKLERKVNFFTCSIAVRAFFNISGKLPCASKKGYCKTKDELWKNK